MSLVTLEISPKQIATVTLNDPDRRNAMGADMATEFAATIASLKGQPKLRAVILTGAGSAFAAGGDLQMLKQKSQLDVQTNAAVMLQFYKSFLSILDLPVPVVAAVNGHAIGAGFCVALACEARVVASAAKLGLNFVKLGLHPGMGATCLLPRIAGVSVANDLLISGRVIDAKTALQMGLANSVEPAGHVLEAAHAVAESYLSSGPSAVRGLLETLRPAPEVLERFLLREASQQGHNYATAEFLEGVTAAIEKRAPDFS